jgi:hypothetical protein
MYKTGQPPQIIPLVWGRFVDEINARTHKLKCNKSTAMMSARTAIGLSGLAMQLRSEGYDCKMTIKPMSFGHPSSVASYATMVRKEIASALKKTSNDGGSGSGGGNRGRLPKRARAAKTEGRTKGVCYKFNDNDGCDRSDCRFKHVCENCGKGGHPKTACVEAEE